MSNISADTNIPLAAPFEANIAMAILVYIKRELRQTWHKIWNTKQERDTPFRVHAEEWSGPEVMNAECG